MKKALWGLTAVFVFIIVVGPILFKFNEILNDNISPQSMYKSEIDDLQDQVQAQLNAVKKSDLPNEKVVIVIFNASLASMRLREAEQWIENGAFIDAQNRLNSAKNWLNENKKLLRKGG